MRKLPIAGSRVGVVCGPGELPRDHQGIVLSQITDRWGTHALVLMDDGTSRTCEGLTEVGIGWYQLNGDIKTLQCACCGTEAIGRQWHNRDIGYGLCEACADWIAGRETAEYLHKGYGVKGIHYYIEKE